MAQPPHPPSPTSKAHSFKWYKAQLCGYFILTGGPCPYGDACIFAHSEAELRAVGTPLPPRVSNRWRAECPHAPRDPLLVAFFDASYCCRYHAAMNAREALSKLRREANRSSFMRPRSRRRSGRVRFYPAPTKNPYANVGEAVAIYNADDPL